jgi:hypothetical protein
MVVTTAKDFLRSGSGETVPFLGFQGERRRVEEERDRRAKRGYKEEWEAWRRLTEEQRA